MQRSTKKKNESAALSIQQLLQLHVIKPNPLREWSSHHPSSAMIEKPCDFEAAELLRFTFLNFPLPQPSILKLLANAAIKSRDIKALIVLINHNANPLIASVIELIVWDTPDEDLLDYVLTNGTAKEIAELVKSNIKRKYEDGISNPTHYIPECAKKLLSKNDSVRRKLLAGVLDDQATIIHIIIIKLLVQFGVKSSDFCQLRFKHFRPLHVATVLALESEICEVIDYVMESGFTVPSSGKVLNDTGESPYHLVVKSNACLSHKINVCNALNTLKPLVDPTVRDKPIKKKEGKQAKQYVTDPKDESLYDLLVKVEEKFMESKATKQSSAPVSEPQLDPVSCLKEQMSRVLSPNYVIQSVDNRTQNVNPPCNRSTNHAELLQKLKFESYHWAIEASPQAFKMLKAVSSSTPECYFSITEELAQLAKGKCLQESTTLVTSNEIKFYQTTVAGCQILWEKAIQIDSVREEIKYFKQIIRLWDLRMINNEKEPHNCFDITIKQITDSYDHVKCTPLSVLQSDHNGGNPLVYCSSNEVDFSSPTKFYPAARTGDRNYSAVQFYAVTEKFIEAIYTKCESRIDFPLKLWPEENSIIEKSQKTPVLLLGRSGTGKTTCCLYRLWNQFQHYWNPDNRYLYDCSTTEGCETPLSVLTSGKCCETKDEGLLRQIFVTKNNLLCDAVKKKFYDFCVPYVYLEEHLKYAEDSTPLKLSDVHPHQYPLFLSSLDFILLLDRTLPGESYFGTKDPNKFRIVNTDYGFLTCSTKTHVKTWVQITGKFFVKHIWPKMLHKYPTKHIDPALVWMEIISFIKGSSEALQNGRPLQQHEYELIGKKLAPNYADVRADIYALFKAYKQIRQNWSTPQHGMNDRADPAQKHQTIALFDECDLISNVYKRLLGEKSLPCAPHSIYIDEVQDFSQAELFLLFVCCLKPNDLFFTGDTAQSVMQGISFRFEDVRSIFACFKEKLSHLSIPGKDDVLVTNYRSHSGVLNLAASVIDLMNHFFKQSFDSYLPRDKGILDGPCPLLIDDHCNIEDRFIHDQLPSSEIAFGAHQAVIVRSNETKETLPKSLQCAIVLTVYEAKGLEFDDVLLYNFFSDSLVDKKTWRTILSYSEEGVAANFSPLSYPLVEFDSKLHKGLNSELKSLYTAVTRAKSKLWIFESDDEKCDPMYRYWCSRHVATKDPKQSLNLGNFANASDQHDWKEQGDKFKNHEMYPQALHCYKLSGQTHLQREMEAHIAMSDAHASTEDRFTTAAVLLLKANELCNDPKYICKAAECLEQAMKPEEAALLYEKIGELQKAFDCFLDAKDHKNCIRIRENEKKYKEAVEVYDEEDMRLEALQLAKRYINENVPDMVTISDCFAHKYALLYAKQKDRPKFETVLSYIIIPAPDRIAMYWKVFGEYRIALDTYKAANMVEHALQLMYEQEWYGEGFELAKEKSMDVWFLNFAVQKAQPVVEQSVNNKVECLQQICDLPSLSTWHPVFHLLLSFLRRDSDALNRVMETQKTRIGKIEAYRFLFQLRENHFCCKHSIKVVIDACYGAYRYAEELHYDTKELLSDIMQFYGMKHDDGGKYVIPPGCCIWRKNGSKIKISPDLNGMVHLDAKETKKEIIQHLSSLPVQYLQDTEMDQQLQNMSQSLDKMISSSLPVQESTVQKYLNLHINWLHYCHFMKQPPRNESIKQLMNASYIHGSFQIKTIRRNKGACKHICQWLKRNLPLTECQTVSLSQGQTILLFLMWKACHIISPVYENPSEGTGVSQGKQGIHQIVLKTVLRMAEVLKLIDNKTFTNSSELTIDQCIAHIMEVEAEMVDTKLLMSILEIMTIYATNLLSKISAVCGGACVVVPQYYRHTIDLLEIEQGPAPVVDKKTLMELLSKCLKVLISDGLLEKVLLQSDNLLSCHYLILALTVVGNMEEPQQFIQEIRQILNQFTINGDCPSIIVNALKVLSSSNWKDNVLMLIKDLLHQLYPYKRGLGLSKIVSNKVKIIREIGSPKIKAICYEVKVTFVCYNLSSEEFSLTEQEITHIKCEEVKDSMSESDQVDDHYIESDQEDDNYIESDQEDDNYIDDNRL